MNTIDNCANALALAIQNGETYQRYRKAQNELDTMPEIKKKVDEVRRLNYMLQNHGEETALYEAIEEMEQQFEILFRIPQVSEFFEAELSLCKQLKKLNIHLYQGINLDIPDL